MEDNRVDKILLGNYSEELASIVGRSKGLDDINEYRKQFEQDFAKYIGTRHALAVNSGTDAIQLALLSLNIGKGDSVIVPDLTYVSTALTVKYAGAEPIIIDVKNTDLTLNEDLVAKHIRKDTKAIIAVHMFGTPCAMNSLNRIARKFNLYIIEDACQAIGSTYAGRRVGSLSDIAAFSFSYYKPLSSLAGNGGMITFENNAYQKKINNYLNLWKIDPCLLQLDRKFNRISLSDIATTKVKFKILRNIISSREKIKILYEKNLSKIKSIKVFKDPAKTSSVKENYPVFFQERDRLRSFLLKNCIKTDLPYTPLHLLEIFKDHVQHKDDFPVSEAYFNHGIHLPLYSFMPEEDCYAVINAIQHFK